MTNERLVLKELKRRPKMGVTRQHLNNLGILGVTQRISDLKKQGYDISTTMVTGTADVARHAVYRIAL